MKDVRKLYGHSAYFTAISYILWPFGILSCHFGMLYQEIAGNPASNPASSYIEADF
jgi:hypothetical protein